MPAALSVLICAFRIKTSNKFFVYCCICALEINKSVRNNSCCLKPSCNSEPLWALRSRYNYDYLKVQFTLASTFELLGGIGLVRLLFPYN